MNFDEIPTDTLRKMLQMNEMDARNEDFPKHIRVEANRRARQLRDYLLIREYNAAQ